MCKVATDKFAMCSDKPTAFACVYQSWSDPIPSRCSPVEPTRDVSRRSMLARVTKSSEIRAGDPTNVELTRRDTTHNEFKI